MKGAAIISLVLFVSAACASPVALERENEGKPISVVDIPAGIAASVPEVVEEKPVVEEIKPVVEDVAKAVEKVDDQKPQVEGASGEQDPNVFGIRFPSILIIRRPPMFQDPFAGFQSPFFGGFNRRPIFAPPPFVDSAEQTEKVKERETVGSESKVDGQKANETVFVNNAVQRMHQQFSNLFANLFNPEAFAMPQRPAFPQFPPRPFFSRPSIFSPLPEESSEEDTLNFDKLPANYKNSTSETKLIDGQLVTVNKTVHKISGNNSNGFFHFSVINVRPSPPKVPEMEAVKPVAPESSESVPQTVVATPEIKTEPVATVAEMDPAMNEVDRADHEKLDDAELKSTYEIKNDDIIPSTADKFSADEDTVKIVPIKSEKLIQASQGKQFSRVSDLSSDIRVNNLMENSQQARVRALFDPEEVEIFEV